MVALEPQPGPARALRLIHGRDRAVTLIEAAAGDRPGELALLVNSANPTVSTAPARVAAAAGSLPSAWWTRALLPSSRSSAATSATGSSTRVGLMWELPAPW